MLEPMWIFTIKGDCKVPTSTTFISFPEFRNRNCSLVVESMSIVDPAKSTDRQSRRIAEVKPARMLVLPPISATSLHRRSYCGVGRNPRTSKLRINEAVDSWIYVDIPRLWDLTGIGRQLAETSELREVWQVGEAKNPGGCQSRIDEARQCHLG